MNAAAEDFCKARVTASFKWSGTNVPDATKKQGYYKTLQTEGDEKVLISMTWTNYVVANNKCPLLDMSAAGAEQLCKDRFGLITNNCRSSRRTRSELIGVTWSGTDLITGDTSNPQNEKAMEARRVLR